MAESAPSTQPDWQPGRRISLAGRKTVVVLGGAGSRTGDGRRAFAPLLRVLAQHGYSPDDAVEASYAAANGDGEPRPYGPVDTRQSLLDSAEAVAACLDWYRRSLPADQRLFLVSYSLGGVVALDGATLALARDQAGWQGRLSAVMTIASPVRGLNLGTLVNLAWLVTNDPEGLGEAGDDLRRRWEDPREQERVERRAAFLRAQGVAVITLADPDDAIIRPDEALLLAPGESQEALLVPTTRVRSGSHGHGVLLDEPQAWERITAVLGPQIPRASTAAGFAADDPVEQELRAIKERLRREGRLR